MKYHSTKCGEADYVVRVAWIKGNKAVDIAPIISSCSLSEGEGEVGTLDITIEESAKASPQLGDTLLIDGEHKGKIFIRENDQHVLTCTSYDILQQFKGQKYYVFPTIDLGSRIKVMCADLAVSYGFLEKSPNLSAELFTQKAYGDIIQAGQDKLLATTGERYIHRVEGLTNIAFRKLSTLQTNYLLRKVVLESATYKQSAEDMKNVVEVYQKQENGTYIKEIVGDRTNMNKFGVLSMSEEDSDNTPRAGLKTKAKNLLYTNNNIKSELDFSINKLATFRPFDILSVETADGMKAGYISSITKDFIAEKTDITLSVLGE